MRRDAVQEVASVPQTGPQPWATALYDDAGFLFNLIGARSKKLFTEALAPLGLRPKHYSTLSYLARVEGSTQRVLVEGLSIDASTMVALIDDFERLGLAERRAHPDDRRAYALYLTPHGRQVLASAREAARAVEEQLLAPFEEQERTVLRALLVRAAGDEGDEPSGGLRSAATRRRKTVQATERRRSVPDHS